MTVPNRSSPGTSDATCYLERSKVREILIGHNAATQAVLPKIDALPIFTVEDMRASAMTTPMTSREALQDALDEWAMANLPTESAGCITSWSDWIAAFVCDGVFGDSQMHPLSDIRDLDEVVRELGIQDSGTTPAEAIRELNAEIERLRSVAQAAASPDIFAIHAALATANIEYAAFSCNGFNLVGDSKSIKEAARAFHSHAQIDEFRTQIRHWREECGKLHAKLAASPVPSTQEKTPKPEPARWPAKGDTMAFLGKNGYPFELEAALKIFTPGKNYRVHDCNVESWSHSVQFDGVKGWHNGVMFELCPLSSKNRGGE